jgi:DNA repair protein RecO
MSLVTTKAFILRLEPLSEKDLVAALLTADHGVVRAAVRGARGKSKRAAALQLLSEVTVTYFRKEGADLARLDALELGKSAFDLATKPESAMLLPYLAESAAVFVPESEPGSDVYRLIRHVLDALEAGVDARLAARYFEAWLLRFAGLLPDDAACAACGGPLPPGNARLDATIPGFVSSECAGRETVAVPGPARALLAAIRRGTLGEVAAGHPPAAAISAVDEVAREVRRRFLGHELKSYRFLGSLG